MGRSPAIRRGAVWPGLSPPSPCVRAHRRDGAAPAAHRALEAGVWRCVSDATRRLHMGGQGRGGATRGVVWGVSHRRGPRGALRRAPPRTHSTGSCLPARRGSGRPPPRAATGGEGHPPIFIRTARRPHVDLPLGHDSGRHGDRLRRLRVAGGGVGLGRRWYPLSSSEFLGTSSGVAAEAPGPTWRAPS